MRGGFVARGLTYGIIGVLAGAVALGVGGATTSQEGALGVLASAPLGKVALVAVAVGLLAYAAWKFILVIVGTGPQGGGGDGVFERIRNLAGGVAYVSFFVIALRVLLGSAQNQTTQTRHATAGVLGWPAGDWIVGLAGLILIIICAVQAYEAVRKKFMDDNQTQRMGAGERRVFSVLGRIGLSCRALVFAIIGYFLIRSAIDFDPRKAVSVDGALQRAAQQPLGTLLLGLVAAGLILFAFFSFAEARYRRL